MGGAKCIGQEVRLGVRQLYKSEYSVTVVCFVWGKCTLVGAEDSSGVRDAAQQESCGQAFVYVECCVLLVAVR